MGSEHDDHGRATSPTDAPENVTDRGDRGDAADKPGSPPTDTPDHTPGDERPVRYEVNGELQQTEQPRLTLEEILRRAGAGAGIDVSDIDNYYLERLSDGHEYRSLSDVVPISDGDRFLAVYSGKTPVATAEHDITRELRELGFAADVLHVPGLGGDQAAVFDYRVETGSHKGQTFRVGVSFQEAEYPEYPPHFIWVAGLPAAVLPAHSNSHHDGVDWCAFSVPPSDFWDRLPVADKNMKTYLTRHMRRFWDQV